jgi:hypothetical protein
MSAGFFLFGVPRALYIFINLGIIAKIDYFGGAAMLPSFLLLVKKKKKYMVTILQLLL